MISYLSLQFKIWYKVRWSLLKIGDNTIIIMMTHSSRLPCCCKDVKEILLKQLGGEAPKI